MALMEPAPPGETGVELHGGEAFAAMHERLLHMSEPARLTFPQVTDIAVERAGGWFLITVKFRGTTANEVTFRIRRAWATVLWQRLGSALKRRGGK